MRFNRWLENRVKMDEMMGSVASIVSCKDLNSKDFQLQGSGSNLGCRRSKKNNVLKMKFNGDK